MGAALIRRGVTKNLFKLLPRPLPPTHTAHRETSLYRLLSRTPNVKGMMVYQARWSQKNAPDSYWKVSRARFKCEGTHGKAWGILYWKGKQVNSQPELIRGGLKYPWMEGKTP